VLAVTLAVVDVSYFVTGFQSLALWDRQRWDDGMAYSRTFVQPVAWARIALLAVLAGWVIRFRLLVESVGERAWRITSSSGSASPGDRPLAGSSTTSRTTS
jgi:hypothetical protein